MVTARLLLFTTFALAKLAMGIMQVDVAGDLFPPGTSISQVSATFSTTHNPSLYRTQTSVLGPDENFGNWSFIFDYDQGALVMPSMASQRVVGDFVLYRGCPGGPEDVQHWNPEGEMSYAFDVPFPYYTYEMPTFTMQEFPECGTGVGAQVGPEQPGFVMGAAFPNPFNPLTTIPLLLQQSTWIRMEIFDLQGHLLARLLDDFMPAGEHQFKFQSANLPSGPYLCRVMGRHGGQSQLLYYLK